MSKIGIVGGSGLYQIEGLRKIKEVSVKTPFGFPSDKFVTGVLEGRDVVFLPRHGKGHRISPSEINYRANVFGMKKLGVDILISVTACGSLREKYKPLDFVIPDQCVDRTNHAREATFFSRGIVAHIAFAHPICLELADILYNAAKNLGINVHKGGTYLNMEGPAFSTKAESELYRSWGMDIIGMTNVTEAKLAREAEMCYATLAAVTDYDCWFQSAEEVTVDMVIQNLLNNVDASKRVIKNVLRDIGNKKSCKCNSALKDAIITNKDCIPKEIKKDLRVIIGKYVK
ncbi:S-methyl-5'-thioadenosine phosphorylase [Candidatus Omnitrophota bacterium]